MSSDWYGKGKRRGGWARGTCAALVGVLFTGLLGAPVAAAAQLSLRGTQQPDPVPTTDVRPSRIDLVDETAERDSRPRRASWPSVGHATLDMTGKRAGDRTGRAGSLPVKLRPRGGAGPEKVQVQVLGRAAAEAAGVDGVVLAVRGYGKRASKGTADLSIDYSGFRDMYGGGWSSRLQLRELPECALTTPGRKGCAPGSTIESENDPESNTLTASVRLDAADREESAMGAPVASSPLMRNSATRMAAAGGTTLLAVSAAAAGGAGDFTATSLAPSGTWSAGGSSGGFTWTYPLETPSVPGDFGPDMSLGYSSQAVDGRTAATNNQANWIGDGWSLDPGFIERRYVSCEDDKKDGNNTTRVGDQCWKKDNATLSLGGSSSELVKDGSEWRKQDDDGTRVARLTSMNRGNGDNDGEYWRVTSPEGIRYYFGYNRLPGWSEGKPETNSTWTVPVFGNHSGEPCHATAFKDSWCQQAWRWNLDYAVDRHGNAVAYYWNKETNRYARNMNASTGKGTPTAYTRGGYLKRVEYGLKSNRMFADQAAAKVDFTVSERCFVTDTFDCAPSKFTKANASKWRDVPFDQYCKSGDDCEDNSSPSYWTRKRLTGVTTSVLTGNGYQKVDSWRLTHAFPSTGDGNDPPLWLRSVRRTGHTGSEPITLPTVNFRGVQMPNRVAGVLDPVPPYNRFRVHAIDTETGGTIGVTYSKPECKADSLPSPSSNTKRCYPVMWSPPENPGPEYEPYEDWFHSYNVTQVLEADNTGGAPVKQTSYRYLGGLAWAKGEDEFTKPKHRTWGDRRGYGRVQVIVGTTDDKQTLTETRYFRGINGAAVADGEGKTVTDRPEFAGMERETATYNGVGGDLVEAASYTPWRSAVTASHSREGLPDLEARRTGVRLEETRTAVSGGKLRRTSLSRTFDSYGMTTEEADAGDTAVTGDERCTTTKYVRNTDRNLLTQVSETRTVAKACDQTPSLPEDLVSAKRYYYDGATSRTTPPTAGALTRLDQNDGAGTGFVTSQKLTYDTYGRVLTTTDASGGTVRTQYVPATLRAPERTVVTNQLGHTSTTHTDPRRALPTAVVDANGKRSDATYDALGRVTQAWEPGWPKSSNPNLPSATYTYSVSKTKPVVTTAKTLQYDSYYSTSHTFYDGLLRPRQTQAPAVGVDNGRIITETHYDTLGRAWKTYSPYYTTGKPSTTLVAGDDTKVPAATRTTYDGVGRSLANIALKFGDETKRTTTSYTGDRTTVVPPAGGTATTTVTNARGQVTERLSYTDAARTNYVRARYEYGIHGQLTRLTDAAGNRWTWTHDARGREIESNDPDKGRSTTEYNDLDQVVRTTDARGKALTHTYDELGRRTELKEGSTLRASWTYDTVAKGQPTSDTRYVSGQAYTSTIQSYNDRYQPTASTVTLPTREGSLAGTYRWTYGYNQYIGVQEWVLHPALGGLPSERTTTVFGPGNLPVRTSTGGTLLVGNVVYDPLAQPIRTEYGVLGRKVYDTRDFDEHTGMLTRRTLDGDIALRVEDTHYTYDDAGNTKRIRSVSGQDAQAVTDNQCFQTDALQRLTQAWTTRSGTNTCASNPSATNVGGPDAYWHSYSYDITGNRTKETQHATRTGEKDVTRDYTYGTPGTRAASALREVTTEGGPTERFTYDALGNTTSRTGGARDQTFTWDSEGHLATVTQGTAKTSYVYSAAGDRLVARDGDGTTTAYLPAGNELKSAPGGKVTATRYYQHGGETVAVRTDNRDVTLLFPDHQGTAMIAIAWGLGQAVTRRKQLPFGALRSEQSTNWPGTRGFVGGTTDPTGTTHLGAREYDPSLGRFMSVDPLLIPEDQRQHNPYQYGNNNPATFSDPTGEALDDCVSGQYNCGYDRKGRLKTVTFSKNYESYTKSVGGTVSPNYTVERHTGYRHVYTRGKGVTTPTASQVAAAAEKERKRLLRIERKAAEKQRKQNEREERLNKAKRDSIFKRIKNVFSGSSTAGACASMSIGLGGGYEFGGCLVNVTRPDGRTDFAVTGTHGFTGPSLGINGTFGMVRSNADDLDQVRGDGVGFGVTAAYGIAATFGYEEAVGAVNSRGEGVSSVYLGAGVGMGVEGEFVGNKTRATKLWTW
ncbi:RHS repeat protein [Streptomyces sp. OF3]|uniref:RHS repeat protein n=1 Tax=Streptomyces alkaliterrae TaxID=2213162 RepID=A0A7W3ZNG3_9ACTN|nr:RHS repeat-associated core domain-containing protein [Streptomyces alkaliterrae]MBB1254397.1 RHS repeat protein [Streptomyces alkaliterrae]